VGRASVLSADGREVQCGPSVPDGQRASSGSSPSLWRQETRRPSGLGTGQRAPEKSEQAVGAWKANVAPHSYRLAFARRSEPESTTNQSGVRDPSAVDGDSATRPRRSVKRGPKPHRAARCRCGAGGSPRLQSWVADRLARRVRLSVARPGRDPPPHGETLRRRSRGPDDGGRRRRRPDRRGRLPCGRGDRPLRGRGHAARPPLGRRLHGGRGRETAGRRNRPHPTSLTLTGSLFEGGALMWSSPSVGAAGRLVRPTYRTPVEVDRPTIWGRATAARTARDLCPHSTT